MMQGIEKPTLTLKPTFPSLDLSKFVFILTLSETLNELNESLSL